MFERLYALLLLFICTVKLIGPSDGVANNEWFRCAKDKADLIFLVDSSTSVQRDNFSKILQFVDDTVRLMRVGQNDTRIGVVKFTGHPVTEFSLSDHYNQRDIVDRIHSIRYVSGVTHLGAAIQHVVDNEYRPNKGDRPGVLNTVVIMSDGLSQDDVIHPSAIARSREISFIAVAIGKFYGKDQLMDITGGREERILRFRHQTETSIPQTLYAMISKVTEEDCSGSVAKVAGKVETSSSGNQWSSTGDSETSAPIYTQRTDISTQCSLTGLTVTIHRDTPFTGWVFVRGQGDPRCQWDFTANNKRTISLTINYDHCGSEMRLSTNPSGVFISTSILLMRHPVLFQNGDAGYRLQCFYGEQEKDVRKDLEVNPLTTTSTIERHPEQPDCTYSIRHGTINGPIMKFAKLGNEILHRWECESAEPNGGDIYAMLVHSCYLKGAANRSILIIDEHGCPTMNAPVRTPDYHKGALVVSAKSTVVAFPDVDAVNFQCKISICLQDDEDCRHRTPPACKSTTARRARSATYNGGTMDLNSGPLIIIDTFESQLPEFALPNKANWSAICWSPSQWVVVALLTTSFLVANVMITVRAVRKC